MRTTSTFRPYAIIEEASGEQVAAMEGTAPKAGQAPRSTVRAYPVGRGPDADYLFYGVRNVGAVAAHGLRHAVELVETEERTGIERPIPMVEPDRSGSEALLPGQNITRVVKFPHGTFFRDDPTEKVPLARLRITFTGVRGMDPRRYYYTVSLRSVPVRSPEEMNRGWGGVTVESSDEGIEAEG